MRLQAFPLQPAVEALYSKVLSLCFNDSLGWRFRLIYNKRNLPVRSVARFSRATVSAAQALSVSLSFIRRQAGFSPSRRLSNICVGSRRLRVYVRFATFRARGASPSGGFPFTDQNIIQSKRWAALDPRRCPSRFFKVHKALPPRTRRMAVITAMKPPSTRIDLILGVLQSA